MSQIAQRAIRIQNKVIRGQEVIADQKGALVCLGAQLAPVCAESYDDFQADYRHVSDRIDRAASSVNIRRAPRDNLISSWRRFVTALIGSNSVAVSILKISKVS
jgi:hypothetical protein